ncbi:MAG: hypothetical protein WAT70_13285 [Rhizobiaceae bacterium]
MHALLDRLLPRVVDNVFPGRAVALYAFYGLTAVTMWRSLHHLIAPDGGAQSIATIPLDRYPGPASATIVSMFAFWGLSQLIVGLVYVVAALRYRALIPLLLLLAIVEYVARMAIPLFKPFETAGTAPGAMMNLPMVVVLVILLAASLTPGKSP